LDGNNDRDVNNDDDVDMEEDNEAELSKAKKKKKRKLLNHKLIREQLPDAIKIKAYEYIVEFKIASSMKPLIYDTQLCISNESIVAAACNCVAGASTKCVHVRYALYLIDAIMNKGSTVGVCEWKQAKSCVDLTNDMKTTPLVVTVNKYYNLKSDDNKNPNDKEEIAIDVETGNEITALNIGSADVDEVMHEHFRSQDSECDEVKMFDELSESQHTAFLPEIDELFNLILMTKGLSIVLKSPLVPDINNKLKPQKRSLQDLPLLATLIYLRTGLTFERIAILMDKTRQTISAYVINTLKLLKYALGTNLHTEEKKIVLDTTAVTLQKPKLYLFQRLTWSEYYHSNVAKFLVCTTLDGRIIFCSRLYPGATSDDDITIHDYLPHVQSGKTYLADKGFTCKSSFYSKSASLVTPFRVLETIMTPHMVNQTSEIATERIVVERAIGKIKRAFTVMETSFRLDLCEKVEKVVYVCAILSNYI